MSQLDDLIRVHCSGGVEWKTLEECCNILDNKRRPISKLARIAGKYPYYGANGIQDYVADYIFDGCFVLIGEDGSVITPNKTPVVNWASGRIWVNNHAHIIAEKEGTLLRYLFYFLQTVDISHLIRGAIPKLTGKDFRAIKIPLPPLEVQREIVGILDLFDRLTLELTESLSEELELRKKQYAYYREVLLSFDEKSPSVIKEMTKRLCSEGVEWKTLDEVFTIRNGYTPSKANPDYWEGGTIPWFRMDDVRTNGRILEDSIQHITPAGVKGKLFEKDSIILATTATIGEHALLMADALANQQFTNFAICKSLKERLLPKFAFYYFFMIDEWCKKNTRVSSFPSVDMKKLKKQPFPLPPLEIQHKIVEILDKFDTLTTSLTEGIPAEIEARRKQYTYYRNKLLTFKEKQ